MITSLLKPTVVVNGKKYKVMKQIGEGGFAFVYNVMSANKGDSGERYALKKMICQTDEQLDEAKKEIDTMVKIQHPNILPLLEFAYVLNKKGQKEVLLVLPLYQCSVQTIIEQGAGYPQCAFADGLDVLKILRQIVEGLGAIHACGLRHADLKPANILISESHHAVITDFGSVSPAPVTVSTRAEALSVQEEAATFTTAPYRAPELYNTPSLCVIGCESDLWSLGCLIYCMFYSRSPFETAAEGLSTLSVMSAHYQIPEFNLWPQEYLDVISGCLTVDPAERLTLSAVQAQLHCIPCPPLNLHVPPPSPPSITHTTPPQPTHAPLKPLAAALAQGGASDTLGSSTSTTSSAVSTGQIDFSASTASLADTAASFPPTPASPPDPAILAEMNFAEFPNPEETLPSGESEAYMTKLSDAGTGSKDEFASCGSALSGLVFDDHNIEGSVFNSSVADSYVIAEGFEGMSNLSTGDNSPTRPVLVGDDGGAARDHKGSTPRSMASFEGYELTEIQLRKGQYGADVPVEEVVTSTTSTAGAAPTETGHSQGSEQFDSDEEFGEFTTGDDSANLAATTTAVPEHAPFVAFAEAAPASPAPAHVPAGVKSVAGNTADAVAPMETLDLAKIITEQSLPADSKTGRTRHIVKEGPVYMMRQGGFPKRWAKKQVWLVLTPLGVLLRKDEAPDSRLHEILSLHRPTHLTPTDTLSIGLNGLLVQGSTPLPPPATGATAHPSSDKGPCEWANVGVDSASTGAAAGTAESHVTEVDGAQVRPPTPPRQYRVLFEPAKFEISFDSKDAMNDWIDAIMECREALL